MKSSTNLNKTVGNLKCAIFAYDVSKDSLNFFSRIGTKTYERCFNNRSDIVETQLGMMVELAKKAGMEKIPGDNGVKVIMVSGDNGVRSPPMTNLAFLPENQPSFSSLHLRPSHSLVFWSSEQLPSLSCQNTRLIP